MTSGRPEAEDREPAEGSAAQPIRSGEQDAVGEPSDSGVDGRTDAEREAADFGGD